MKQKMKKVICMAVIGALALSSAVGDNVTSQAAAKTKKIVMNKKKVTLKVGKTFKLKVKKVKPAKASKAVTYKSKSKKIATVSKKGVIKGKKAGKTTITVTSKKNKKAKAKVTVTVKKAVDDQKPVTTPAPSNTPAASATPGVTNAPVVSGTPATAPATEVPAATTPAGTKTPATQKPPVTTGPTKAPASTATPNIIDLDEYKIDLKKTLWTNEYYERKDNSDGSVTLTRGNGDADWQVGEFGFELPRNEVGDQHKFKGIIIKYKDSTLTDPAVGKGICGYVIHSRAQCAEIEAAGRDNNIGWYDFQDNPKEKGHDGAVEFSASSNEAIIQIGDDEDDFSAVRIYDGVIGGKITIESITVIKMETPGPETPGIESPGAESPDAESPATEKSAGSENEGNILKELWADTSSVRKSLLSFLNLI